MQNYKKNFVTRTLAWVLTVVMVVTMLPMGVFAENPSIEPISLESVFDKARFDYKDSSKELNWEDVISTQDFYWPLEEGQILQRVRFTDPINITSLDFDGYYINNEGKTVLRLVYNFYASAASSWWYKLNFRFDKNLYEKIDWSKSGIRRSSDATLVPFNDTRKTYQKEIMMGGPQGVVNETYVNRACFLPVELVLENDTLESLGDASYFVQMRVTSSDNKYVYAYAPKGSRADYTTYTFTTPIIVGENEYDLFLPGGIVSDPYARAAVRGRTLTADFNPSFDRLNDIGKLSLQYMFRHSNLASEMTSDDRGNRPFAFVIGLDKKILDSIPKNKANPSQTIIGNTQGLNSNKKPVGTQQSIKRENVFVKGNVAYIMVVNNLYSNYQTYNIACIDSPTEDPNVEGFKKAQPVIVTDLNNTVYSNKAMDFATVEFLIDNKKALQNIDDTSSTGGITNYKNYIISSGFLVPNSEGWKEYSYEFKEDLTIGNPGTFRVLMSKDVPGKYNSIHASFEKPQYQTKAIMKDFVGYYHDLPAIFWSGTTGRHADIQPSDNGKIQDINLLGGRQIKKGDILRVWVQNPGYTGIPLFITNINWNTKGQTDGDGGYDLNIKDDYYVHGQLTKAGAAGAPRQVQQATFTYTPAEYDETKPEGKDNPQTKVVKITREGTFKSSDTSVFEFKNAAVIAGGTTFKIDMRKVKPGTKAVLRTELNDRTIKEAEIATTGAAFKDHGKDDRPFYFHSSKILGMMSLRKAHYLPKQDIFTNDYSNIEMKTNTSGVISSGSGDDEVTTSTFDYKTYKQRKDALEKFDPLTENLDKFMTNTSKLVGYSRYKGGSIVNGVFPKEVLSETNNKPQQNGLQVKDEALDDKYIEKNTDQSKVGTVEIDMSSKVKVKDKNGIEKEYKAYMYALDKPKNITLKKDMQLFFTNSEESSLYSKWKEERVRTRVLFDKNTDENFTVEKTSADNIVKIVPDNEKYYQDPTYVPNGFNVPEDSMIDDNGNKLTGDELALRQWPAKDMTMERDNKTYKLLGWATGQIKPNDFLKAPELKKVEQWNDKSKVYRVTEHSPIDSHQVVYGVWGEGVKVLLHSNNGEEETIKEIIVFESDFKDNKAEVKIPKAPYWNGDTTVKDEEMKKFVKADVIDSATNENRHTFVGWSTVKEEDELLIGYNYSELAATDSATRYDRRNRLTEAENNKKAFKIESLEPYHYTYNETVDGKQVQGEKTTRLMLPNEYKLVLTGTYKDWAKKEYVHLYAHYRPFFTVEVHKQYQYIQNEDKTNPVYADSFTDAQGKTHNITENDKREVNIGLLFRTAVTDYTDPTVHEAANYYSFGKDSFAFESLPGFGVQKVTIANNFTVKFHVPGFDELGQRRSYSAVEVDPNDDSAYYSFKNKWSDLGITIYTRFPNGLSQGPIDPKDNSRTLSKVQSFTLNDNDPNTLDSFTSATTRYSIKTKEDSDSILDLKGYRIEMYNVPRAVPQPKFEEVYDGDKSFKLNFVGLDNGIVDGIDITVKDGAEKAHFKLIGNKWTQLKYNDTTNEWEEVPNPIGTITNDDKELVFTKANNEEFKEGDVIRATYYKALLTGLEGQKTVLAKDVNIPVKEMEQEPSIFTNDDKTHKNPTVVIKAKIPSDSSTGVLYEPKAGTVYTLLKPDGNPVIGLDGKPATYTKGAEDTVGTPMIFKFDPKTNGLENDDELSIKTELPGNPAQPVDSKPNSVVKLRLRGPIKDDGLSYTDEDIFRRWMDATVVMDNPNFPADGKFKFEITFKDSNEIKTFEVTSGKAATEELKKLYRTDNIKAIKVTAEDRLGNMNSAEVQYDEVEQIVVNLLTPRVNQKELRLRGPEGVIVTIKITHEGTTKTLQPVTLKPGFNIVKLDFNLATGDVIELEGVKMKEDKVIGRTNFFKVKVR